MDSNHSSTCQILFPADGELTGWVDLLQNCRYESECVQLYNNLNLTWDIRNDYRINSQQPRYQYNNEELLLCLGAHSDGVLFKRPLIIKGHQTTIIKKTSRQICYNAKGFCNEDDIENGFLPYFTHDYILDSMNSQESQADI